MLAERENHENTREAAKPVSTGLAIDVVEEEMVFIPLEEIILDRWGVQTVKSN